MMKSANQLRRTMIPREILKKIWQIELRTNRLVNESARRVALRIPTGFCPKAQGCEARATLGQRSARRPNRNAVVAIQFEDWSALTPTLSPRRGSAIGALGNNTIPSAFEALSDAATDAISPRVLCRAPSPGGEGRGEGGRYIKLIDSTSQLTPHCSRSLHCAFRVPHSALP
jgi:hypothetical protein